MTKAQMEKVRRQRRLRYENNLCRWDENCNSNPGRLVHTLTHTTDKQRKFDFPVWQSSRPKITPSRKPAAKYKRDFPLNAPALLSAYAVTRTKYDAPLPQDYRPLCEYGYEHDEIFRTRWFYWNDRPQKPVSYYPLHGGTR